MAKKAKKDDRGYRDYTTVKDGKLYGRIDLPLGNGKYRTVKKRVKNKTEARDWALEELRKWNGADPVVEGDPPAEPEAEKGVRFGAFKEDYAKRYVVPPIYQNGGKVAGMRSYQNIIARLNILDAKFGPYLLTAISPLVIEEWKYELLLRGLAISSVNTYLSLLKAVLRKAKIRRLITISPFEEDNKLINKALEVSNNKKMTHRKYVRLLAKSRHRKVRLYSFYHLILAARWTGGRPSELFPFEAKPNDGVLREPLTWKAVLDHDFKAVTLISYKGLVREPRDVPATVELERGLRELYAATPNAKPSDLIFPFRFFGKNWANLCKAAKVDDVVFRDFRAFFQQTLVDSGYDEVSRMLILGHKSTKMNRHYSQITPDFIRNFRDRIGSTPPVSSPPIPSTPATPTIEVSTAVN